MQLISIQSISIQFHVYNKGNYHSFCLILFHVIVAIMTFNVFILACTIIRICTIIFKSIGLIISRMPLAREKTSCYSMLQAYFLIQVRKTYCTHTYRPDYIKDSWCTFSRSWKTMSKKPSKVIELLRHFFVSNKQQGSTIHKCIR